MSQNIVSAIDTLVGIAEKQLGNRTNPHAKALLAAQTRLKRASEALVALANNRDTTQTTDAHFYNVSKRAAKLGNELKSVKGKVYDDYRDYMTELATAIVKKANIKPDRFEVEIRQAFRELEPSARMPFINELIDNQDGPGFAALMNAPAILTGLSADMRQKLTSAFHKKVAPELVAEQGALEAGMDALAATFRTVESLTQSYQDRGELARIELSKTNADSASKAFDEAITNG